MIESSKTFDHRLVLDAIHNGIVAIDGEGVIKI